MSLIQKDEKGATPIAKADAKCWASKWMMIRPYFERTTGQRLHPGMKVLLKVYAQFHEAFGFSWIVTDIDPTYTLGDMARKRQEIIRQLKEEGVFDLQKELSLPVFCQRIAVISSETAAGYGDFCNQLSENPYEMEPHDLGRLKVEGLLLGGVPYAGQRQGFLSAVLKGMTGNSKI